jgi:predicted nucleic acid-binding protein
MTNAICDASVVVKWFVEEPGDDLAPSRAILAAHRRGEISAHVLDLTLYEVANVLSRRGGEPIEVHAASTFLHLGLTSIVGALPWLAETAARIAANDKLSFYDASYMAAARETETAIVSADRALVSAGALTPTEFCQRLGLA